MDYSEAFHEWFASWFNTDANSVIGQSSWYLVPIILLTIVLFVLVKKRGKEHLVGFQHGVCVVAFNLMCVLEFGFLSMAGQNFFWFIDPYKVGWLFLVFLAWAAFTAWVQVKAYFSVVNDIQYNANVVKYKYKWGIWALLGLVPATYIAAFVWGDKAIGHTLMFFILFQIVHVFIIFFSLLMSANILRAIVGVFTYIVGFVPFLFMVIPVAVITIGLCLVVRLMPEHSKNKSKSGMVDDYPFYIYYN